MLVDAGSITCESFGERKQEREEITPFACLILSYEHKILVAASF